MKQEGCGYKEWTLIKRRAFSITCFAFVDNTDLIHTSSDPNTTTTQLTAEAQEALMLSERTLRVTGGAPAPEKATGAHWK